MEVAFCQTISFNADSFEYEAVAQENGNATIIKFPIDEKLYSPGDVVVVVSGEDINFHGIIGKIEDGQHYCNTNWNASACCSGDVITVLLFPAHTGPCFTTRALSFVNRFALVVKKRV